MRSRSGVVLAPYKKPSPFSARIWARRHGYARITRLSPDSAAIRLMMPAVVGVAGSGLPLASVWSAISIGTSADGSADVADVAGVGGNTHSRANAPASSARRQAGSGEMIFFI